MQNRIVKPGVRDWDDVRVFLAIARAGSFQKAAELLGANQSTVSRRIAELERRLGAQLFERDNQGARLSPTGRVIQTAARAIENNVLDIERGVAGVDAEMRGRVTITTTEGIAAYWLGPRMLDFQRRNPGLDVYLDTTNELRDLAAGEADIAIRFGRPSAPHLQARQVAKLRMGPFGAKAYLRELGRPRSLSDFAGHYIVDTDRPLTGPLWERWSAYVAASRGVVFRSNSSHVVARAVDEGYGIGLLPSYVLDIYHNLEELPLEIGPPLQVWVAHHELATRSRRVRVTLDYIHKLFEVDRYRYFSG
ncbi:MAG: LysR family transcriptional regulator [Pseudomonadota bacterium]